MNKEFTPKSEVFERAALELYWYSCPAIGCAAKELTIREVLNYVDFYKKCHRPRGSDTSTRWLDAFFKRNPHIDPFLFRKTLLLEMALNIKEQLEG